MQKNRGYPCHFRTQSTLVLEWGGEGGPWAESSPPEEESVQERDTVRYASPGRLIGDRACDPGSAPLSHEDHARKGGPRSTEIGIDVEALGCGWAQTPRLEHSSADRALKTHGKAASAREARPDGVGLGSHRPRPLKNISRGVCAPEVPGAVTRLAAGPLSDTASK